MHYHTLLKINTLVTVVKQSGTSFLFKDVKNGTSGRIQPREVGACYMTSQMHHSHACEFHIQDMQQLMNLLSKIKDFREDLKSELLGYLSGILNNKGEQQSIGELLNYVKQFNKKNREANNSKRIKLSPYSIMIKITLQHFVPKDIKETMQFPERYNENSADFSSNQQVLELRIPVCPSVDSMDSLYEIFNKVKDFINSLNPVYKAERARSTRLSLENLVGKERYTKILQAGQEHTVAELITHSKQQEYVSSDTYSEGCTNSDNDYANELDNVNVEPPGSNPDANSDTNQSSSNGTTTTNPFLNTKFGQ